MRWKFLALSLTLGMFGCRGGKAPDDDPWVGKPFPDFDLPALKDGDTLRSSQLKGGVTLITFWATWCPSCLQEIPILKGVHKTHGPQGLRMMALSVDQDPQLVPPLVRRLGMEYPVATGAEGLHVRMGLSFVPHTFLLDTAGIVRASFTGAMDRESLDRLIGQTGLR